MNSKHNRMIDRIGSLVVCAALLFGTAQGKAVSPAAMTAADKYVRTELYFGLSRKNGPEITDEDFRLFIDEYVTPRFPQGLTFVEARGQWREEDASLTRERTKILILLYLKKDRRSAGAKIEEIRTEYKRRFAQNSVMRVDLGRSVDVSF